MSSEKYKLGIVIVSYNVKYFLEQCLHSVAKAVSEIRAEVYVVDNNSVDGSCAMVKSQFPWVILIENKENLGFSKGNNLAITQCQADYILLLNPDTVVEEKSFLSTVQFMDENPMAGALGVKMIDGKGRFLPESKRGLPTPSAALYKMIGISKLFPKSKKFGSYHMSYLSPDETHEVEILSGAFMMLRNAVIKQIGSLDERFFMYGEDIDLSYRILLAGYRNYYFSGTTIIHYKGESTKKASFNYVKVFYQAMILFARKHFTGSYSSSFIFFIQFAVYLTALASLFKRFIRAILWPALDLLICFGIYYTCSAYWESHKFGIGGQFPSQTKLSLISLFSILQAVAIKASGGYSESTDFSKLSKGLSILIVVELAIYSLLPEYFRFSRFVVIAGSILASLSLLCFRIMKMWWKIKRIELDLKPMHRISVVGSTKEAKRIQELLKESNIKHQMVGVISYTEDDRRDQNSSEILGTISQLKEICRLNKLNEIIFSSKDISSETIIKEMLNLTGRSISFKIAPPESMSIIGSNSIHAAGQLYSLDFNSVGKESNRRKKRLLDIFLSLTFLIILPIHLFTNNEARKKLVYCFKVLINRYTWVGYDLSMGKQSIDDLPKLKEGIFKISQKNGITPTHTSIRQINMNYAKNYTISEDIEIVINQLFPSKKAKKDN